MRNTFKTSFLIAALAATSTLTISSARADGGGMRPAQGNADGFGMRRHGGEDGGGMRRHGGGFGGGWAAPVAEVLGSLMISSAFMEDSTTHYRKDCLYIGGCKVTFITDPDGPPVKPKVEKRKLAPRPIRHVTDKRTGWTYYLAQDRNTGENFIQVVDANGADVHINGSIPMPGGGPIFAVR